MKTLIALVGLTVGLIGSGPTAGAESQHCEWSEKGKILLIGDSHTWLSGCSGAFPRWDGDATTGRRSPAGAGVAAAGLRARHSELVFDLATNDVRDPEAQRSALREVWAALRPGQELTLVTCYKVGSSSDENRCDEAVNPTLWKWRRAHPNRTDVVNWAGYVEDHPSSQEPDGTHFTTLGYEARVALIKSRVP